jgi:chemotaxis protein histidine kinase CheA
LASGLLASTPPSVQRELSALLSAVSTDLAGVVGGSDLLDSLVSSVDQLDSCVWRTGIAPARQLTDLAEGLSRLGSLVAETERMSNEVSTVLAQSADLQTLTQQARDAASATSQAAETAVAARAQIDQLAQQASEAASTATAAQQNAQSYLAVVNESAQKSREAAESAAQSRQSAQEALQAASQSAQQAQTAQTEAAERNTNTNTLLGQAQASRQQIAVLEAELRALRDAGDGFRQKMADTESQAKATMAEARQIADSVITNNTQRTEELLAELKANEDRIKDALQKATGISLFYAYQDRQNQLARGKWFWFATAVALILGAIVWTAYLVMTRDSITSAFYFRLGIAVLVTPLAWFSMAQYSRERRLEEENAFRSNISLSLVPYKELVEKSVVADDASARNRYCEFLISSINKVFTPPAGDRAEVDLSALKSLGTDQLKELTNLLAAFQKIVRP